MTRAIPDGIDRDHVITVAGDLNAGVAQSFGASTGYDVVGGRHHP